MYRILLIEDDKDINNLLRELLEEEGYQVISAFTGIEGLYFAEHEEIDTILLDLMLPSLSGEEVMKKLRGKGIETPIIVISAKLDRETRLEVLKQGADDFISKPFDSEEVLARVMANIRRYRGFSNQTNTLKFGNLKVVLEEQRVELSGIELKVTPIEYAILKLFVEYPKKIYSKENIYTSVWKDEYLFDPDTVGVHVSNLRGKLKGAGAEETIETLWGMGYRLKQRG